MKKIVLAFACSLLAFSGNSKLNGSILVNTVSFADLPDKPHSRSTIDNVNPKANPKTSTCTVQQEKVALASTSSCKNLKGSAPYYCTKKS